MPSSVIRPKHAGLPDPLPTSLPDTVTQLCSVRGLTIVQQARSEYEMPPYAGSCVQVCSFGIDGKEGVWTGVVGAVDPRLTNAHPLSQVRLTCSLAVARLQRRNQPCQHESSAS